LKAFFEDRFGVVVECALKYNKITQETFEAIIRFRDFEGHQLALKADNKYSLHGRMVRI